MNRQCIEMLRSPRSRYCGGRISRLLRRDHTWRMVGRRKYDTKLVTSVLGPLWEVRFECERCGQRNSLTLPSSGFWTLNLEAPERSEQEAASS